MALLGLCPWLSGWLPAHDYTIVVPLQEGGEAVYTMVEAVKGWVSLPVPVSTSDPCFAGLAALHCLQGVSPPV